MGYGKSRAWQAEGFACGSKVKDGFAREFPLKQGAKNLVGAIGFEPTTPCAQGRCATRLRYAPTHPF